MSILTKNQVRQIFSDMSSRAKTPLNRVCIFEKISFGELDDEGKCELAQLLVLESFSNIGTFRSNGDAAQFLLSAAQEFSSWPITGGIADRRIEHVVFALRAIAGTLSFARPLGAISSVYLLHQLEFFFRQLSGVLAGDGQFVDPATKSSIETQLGRRLHNRVNDVALTYRIMRLNLSNLAVKVFSSLESALPQQTVSNGETLHDIGERLAYFRHSVSHGTFGDPSSEGYFYGLLIAISIYGSSLFPRS